MSFTTKEANVNEIEANVERSGQYNKMLYSNVMFILVVA